MSKLRTYTSRFSLLFLLAVYIAYIAVPLQSFAFKQSALDALRKGTEYYDPTAECLVSETGESDNLPVEIGFPTDDRGKLAQLLFVRADDQNQATLLAAQHVGGIFLGNDAMAVNDTAIRALKQTTVPMPLLGVDEEGGRVQKLDTKYGSMPSARTMGSMSDADVTAQATLRAAIMANIGINVDFAPVVDVSDQPNNGVIGDRSFSNNPLIVTAKANAFAAGLRSKKILPVFKHFPGHGHSTGDSHSGAVSTPPLAQMKLSDLVPYTNVMKNGPSGVMVGHLDVPGLTAPNVPTSISKPTIDLLRGEYGFNGLTITDDLGSMKAITDRYGLPEAASLAIQAGNDMALFVGYDKVGAVLDKLVADLNSGALPRARMEEALLRVQAARDFTGVVNQSAVNQQITTLTDASGQTVTDPNGAIGGGIQTAMGGSDEFKKLFIKASNLTGVPAGVLAAQSYQESATYWNVQTFTNEFVKQHSYLEDGGKVMLPPQYQNVNEIGASGPMQLDQWSGPGDYHGNYSTTTIARFKELTGVDFPPHGEFYFDTAIIMGAIVDAGVASRSNTAWDTIQHIIEILTTYGTIPRNDPPRSGVIEKFEKNYKEFQLAIGQNPVGSTSTQPVKCPGETGPDTAVPLNISTDVGFIDPSTLPRLKTTYTDQFPGINKARAGNVLIGKNLAAFYGWDKGNEWMCLYDLFVRESGWNEKADNPTSSAYGIPQALPGSKMSNEGADYLTNPETQIKWGLKYIKGRYQSPCKAIIWHNSHNWY